MRDERSEKEAVELTQSTRLRPGMRLGMVPQPVQAGFLNC